MSLAEIIRYTWEHSSFYRAFWGEHGFSPEQFGTVDDLHAIPILTKERLAQVPLSERTIKTPGTAHYLADISSGTTQTPLVVLKSNHIPSAHFAYAQARAGACQSAMVLRPGVFGTAFLHGGMNAGYFPRGSTVSMGDPRDIPFSAYLAKEIAMDFLVARPSDAIRLAHALTVVGYSPERVTTICCSGEPLTTASASLLSDLYPTATILFAYGMTECPAFLGLRTSNCTTLSTIGPGTYHLDTDAFYFEEYDGRALITTLVPLPTPLIRYDTGDQIQMSKTVSCACGYTSGLIGSVGPRTTHAYKIGGCSFSLTAVRQALATLEGLVTDDFRLEIEQVRTPADTLALDIRLAIRPAGVATPLLIESVLQALKQMPVQKTRSLGDALESTLIRNLEIIPESTVSGAALVPPQEITNAFKQT